VRRKSRDPFHYAASKTCPVFRIENNLPQVVLQAQPSAQNNTIREALSYRNYSEAVTTQTSERNKQESNAIALYMKKKDAQNKEMVKKMEERDLVYTNRFAAMFTVLGTIGSKTKECAEQLIVKMNDQQLMAAITQINQIEST
jgi:hypothetical protein